MVIQKITLCIWFNKYIKNNKWWELRAKIPHWLDHTKSHPNLPEQITRIIIKRPISLCSAIAWGSFVVKTQQVLQWIALLFQHMQRTRIAIFMQSSLNVSRYKSTWQCLLGNFVGIIVLNEWEEWKRRSNDERLEKSLSCRRLTNKSISNCPMI